MKKVSLIVGLLALIACNTHPINDLPLDPVDGGNDPDAQDASSDQSNSDSGVSHPPGYCEKASDCTSFVCTSNQCQAATHTDGVKNGSETDVDCGSDAPKCALGKTCDKHADCDTDVCSYKHICLPVSEMSCANHFGGDTCGVGETDDPKAEHVSCCETAPLFGGMSGIQMDRFLITAGRMRSFIERVNGDVRGFVHTLPANKWKSEYDAYVPSNIDEANVQLGSFFQKKSCKPGDYTGRTYWTPPTADDHSDFTKDQMDEKSINCISSQLVRAFCLWDNRRMPTGDEVRNAFTNGGKHIQPWLWQPGAVPYVQPAVYSENIPYTNVFNHNFTYGYPAPIPGGRAAGLDIAYRISPPGRYPTSWNEHGHEVAGNLLTWVDDGAFVEANTFSWERHGDDGAPDTDWEEFERTDIGAFVGYYAIGGRCVR